MMGNYLGEQKMKDFEEVFGPSYHEARAGGSIRDATPDSDAPLKEIPIFVTQQLIDLSVPGDAKTCVLAAGCGRSGIRALVWATVAHVRFPNSKTIWRYEVGLKEQRLIKRFDPGDWSPAIGELFKLRSVSPANTLEAMKLSTKQREARIRNGEIKIDPNRSALSKQSAVTRQVNQSIGVR